MGYFHGDKITTDQIRIMKILHPNLNYEPMPNPKKPKPKKVQEVTLQIITHSQAKVKKHLKPEDTTEMFSKHKKN